MVSQYTWANAVVGVHGGLAQGDGPCPMSVAYPAGAQLMPMDHEGDVGLPPSSTASPRTMATAMVCSRRGGFEKAPRRASKGDGANRNMSRRSTSQVHG